MDQQNNHMTKRKTMTGKVVSDKMNKTRVVEVFWKAKHSKYHKPVRQGNKFKAHDEENKTKTGDVVRIVETRPLSKDKRWMIKEVVEQAAE